MERLTLIPGQPVPQCDVIGATKLWLSDVNLPGPYLDLTGRPAGTVYDVYRHLMSGDILTEVAPVMETMLTGTPIGGMTSTTSAGGIAAAFDGNLNKGYLACAKSPGVVTGYSIDGAIGLGLSAPAVVNRIAITAPNDNGFIGSLLTTPWQLLGGTGGNYALASVIANGRGPPYTSGVVGRIEVDFPNGIAFDSLWWNCFGSGTNAVRAAQVQMWSTLPMSARGLYTAGGILRNDHIMTATGNFGPIFCAIGDCEFLGQVQIDPGGGTTTLHKSSGLDRRCGYWNAKNQTRLVLRASDPSGPIGGHFFYTPPASPDYLFAPVQGTGLMRATFLNGLADNDARVTFDQCVFQNAVSAVTSYWAAVNKSKCSPIQKWGSVNFDSISVSEGETVHAEATMAPTYGSMTVYALEGSRGNVQGFYGEGNQDLIVEANY